MVQSRVAPSPSKDLQKALTDAKTEIAKLKAGTHKGHLFHKYSALQTLGLLASPAKFFGQGLLESEKNRVDPS